MPIFFGIKSIIIKAALDFTDQNDPLRDYGLKRANEYVFFTLFFIPLIPLRCRQSVRIDQNKNMYKREISVGGKIFNQLFGIGGLFILMILFGLIASCFSGGKVKILI